MSGSPTAQCMFSEIIDNEIINVNLHFPGCLWRKENKPENLAKKRTKNKLSPRMASTPGFHSGHIGGRKDI